MKKACDVLPDWILRHAVWTSSLVLLLTLVGGWAILDLGFDGDIANLLDPTDEVLLATRSLATDYPQMGSVILVLSSENAGPAPSDTLRRTISQIRELPSVRSAFLLPVSHEGATLAAVRLTSHPSDITAARPALLAIDSLVRANGLSSVAAGTPPFLVESSDAMAQDLRRAAAITLIAVVVFMWVFYPVGRIALLAFVPMGIGIVWGLAVAHVFIDKLTLLAATTPTILVGIGIDYCIHLVQATAVRMERGESRRAAIVGAWAAMARPLAIGSGTTALAFTALTVAHLKGLTEMGIVGACITIGAFLATMLLMPLLLAACPERLLRPRKPSTLRLTWLERLLEKHPRRILTVSVALTAMALLLTTRVGLLTDNSRLENTDLPTRIMQERLAREFGFNASPIAVRFASITEASRFLKAYSEDSKSQREISRIDVAKAGDNGLAIVHPLGNPFSAKAYSSLTAEIAKLAASSQTAPIHLAGPSVVNARLTELLTHDYKRVVGTLMVLLVVFLTLALASLRLAALALLPLLCGLLWTGGVMGAAGSMVSVMSVAVAPLIIGVGVDDGLHLLLAWKRTGGDLSQVLRETGVAILATTVTTVAAFGAFIFCATPALVQFGTQASLGLFFCMIAALIVLPAALILSQRKSQ